MKLLHVSSLSGKRPPGMEGGRGGVGGMGSGVGGIGSSPSGSHESWVRKALLFRAASTLWRDLSDAVWGSVSRWLVSGLS